MSAASLGERLALAIDWEWVTSNAVTLTFVGGAFTVIVAVINRRTPYAALAARVLVLEDESAKKGERLKQLEEDRAEDRAKIDASRREAAEAKASADAARASLAEAELHHRTVVDRMRDYINQLIFLLRHHAPEVEVPPPPPNDD